MPKTWIKIHIEFLDNPKVMTLSLALRGVWFTALGVAERYDHEGLLPPADRFALMAHTDDETAEKAYTALAKKGLLDETPEGFRIHDWAEWQAGKPSDEPEARAERQRRWYHAHKNGDLTPPSALGEVREKPNAPNANKIKSKKESEREREKGHLAPDKPTREVKPRPPNAHFDALLVACGFEAGASLTEQEGARIGKAAAQIKAAGGTPEDIGLRAIRYQTKYANASLTPLALAGHWGELATSPRASPNGVGAVMDKADIVLDAWDQYQNGAKNGQGNVQDVHGSNQSGIPPIKARIQ